MKRIIYILLFQLMIFVLGFSQNFEMAVLEEGDIPEVELVETSYFVGKGLYGHINGGSELFHEYGFEALAVQEVKKNGIELIVEIYKMKNAEGAFGIFSVSKRTSHKLDTINYFSCVTPNQTLLCVGNYYISIMNQTENKEAKIYARKITEVLKIKINGLQFKYPEVFTGKLLKKHKGAVKLIAGPIGVQNNLISLETWFDAIENFNVYYLFLEDKDLEVVYAGFKTDEDLKLFLQNAGFENTENIPEGIFSLSKENQIVRAKIIENNKALVFLTGKENQEIQKLINSF